MIKSITSKELRTKFPRIKNQLLKGVSFRVYYRSKPLGDFTPIADSQKNTEKKLTWADLPKFVGHTLDRKPFSAVEFIKKERDDDEAGY